MNDRFPISSADRLLMRLTHAVKSGQRVTFLIGSGFSTPSFDGKEKGVPGPAAMIDRARSLFPDEEEVCLFDEAVSAAEERQQYQAAMQFVIECRGQPAVDKLIREAVLEARSSSLNDQPPDVLERDIAGWSLRAGVESLGRLIQKNPAVFQRPILTSNFDPLLEIAIRRAGGNAVSINLPADGNFNALVVNENIAQVVHFHGFWSQENTLHTPETLSRERPLLAGNLRKLLQETVLVVIGYGGWRDVFTESLLKTVTEQSQGLDVIWTFYTENTQDIRTQHVDLLSAFARLPGQRIVAYAGVDCHKVFPRLLATLERAEKSAPIAIPLRVESVHVSCALRGSANLPETEAWVGRQDELAELLGSPKTVLALNGWGGFGKSSLASKYVSQREKSGGIEGWYWADCREQGNTIQTHLIKILEVLSRGQVSAVSLQKARDEDILELFFDHISKHRVLIVFDNIDHYVDLENEKAFGLLDQVIERAIAADHSCQIILTSRPVLSYESEKFRRLQVVGLKDVDVEELFRLRGAQWDNVDKREQVREVLQITEGSALQLNLIATQVAKLNIVLSALLKRIKEGTASEAEDRILTEIWTTLRPEHQEVLRVLAELPHSEPEHRVGQCLSESLRFNRFAKAVRALKNLNLIVTKSARNSVEVIELHPLVRSFIRKRYPKAEQAPIVEQVIKFFDRMIGRVRGRSDLDAISVIGDWISKIEVCLDHDRAPEALSTLKEIQQTLLSRGFVEEFVRLASLVFAKYQVPEDPAELQKFDAIAEELVGVLGDLGRYQEADSWLTSFEKSVVGKSARYIWLCDIRAYANWIRGDFGEAKRWASEGVQLKAASKVDTGYDCSHNLALARRDSGEYEDALKFFLRGEKVESIVGTGKADAARGGHFYGNIGRCLFFLQRYDEALASLKKSAYLLEMNHNESNVLLNRGWAAMWIGEVQEKLNELDSAYIAFRSAAGKWKIVSPGRARTALHSAGAIVERLSDTALVGCGDWECDEMYRNWLKV